MCYRLEDLHYVDNIIRSKVIITYENNTFMKNVKNMIGQN